MGQREIIRSFVCIEIPEGIREKLEEFLRGLRDLDRRVKWVRGENLHLTLKFLGEEPHTKVEKMRASLQDGIPELKLKPFSLSLRGIGVFPDWDRPRIIWVGVEGDGLGSLEILRDFVEKTARKQGFRKESKPFSPHITLGRAKSDRIEPILKEKLRKSERELFGSFLVREVILMRSQLFPEGPIYTPLATFALEGG